MEFLWNSTGILIKILELKLYYNFDKNFLQELDDHWITNSSKIVILNIGNHQFLYSEIRTNPETLWKKWRHKLWIVQLQKMKTYCDGQDLQKYFNPIEIIFKFSRNISKKLWIFILDPLLDPPTSKNEGPLWSVGFSEIFQPSCEYISTKL